MLNALLVCFLILGFNLGASTGGAQSETAHAFAESRTVFDFQDITAAENWSAVNDSVMGGVSQGQFRINDGILVFHGSVSLENNGGFASLRSRGPAWDLSEYDSLVVRLRGDGNRYAFSVRTNYRIMAGDYYYDFETRAGEWQDVRLPLASFQARSFGRPLTSAPRLNAGDVQAMGFMISDKQEGPFELQVDWVKAVRTLDEPVAGERELTTDLYASAGGLIETAITRGVPLFNAGQPEACAAIYELTARSLLDLCPHELPLTMVAALRGGLQQAQRIDDPGKRAWVLRHSLDAARSHLLQTKYATTAQTR